MNRARVQRWSLGLIALFMLPTAIQATFAPESWYDNFPLGRSWVPVDGGAYDEHLVRDVGVLFLALIIVTVCSVWRREAMTVVAIAWLVHGLLHVGFHIGHLDGLETADQVGLVGSLVSIPILAAVSLLAGIRAPINNT